VLGSLATWRVSHLLAHEDGPMQAVVLLRAAIDRTPLAGVMDCFSCTSVWVGVAVAPLALRGRAAPRDLALAALGLSAAACLLERAVPDHRHDHVVDLPDLLPEPDGDHPWVEVAGAREASPSIVEGQAPEERAPTPGGA
jgi:hypothetical protein